MPPRRRPPVPTPPADVSSAGKDESLLVALREYADSIRDAFASRGNYQPEDQLKAPVSTLVRAAGEAVGLRVRTHTEIVADDEIGRPDIGVFTAELLTGHIELKAPELLDKVLKSDLIESSALPTPTDAERAGPQQNARAPRSQPGLGL